MTSAAPGKRPGRPYRILMLAPTSFFGDYGCHVRILEEARYLQQRGHFVTLCTYPKGQDVPELDIQRSMPLPWRGDYEVGSSRHKIALDFLLGLRSLRLMPALRPDIIHSHLHEGALIGAMLSRLWRVPQVFDFQGSMSAEMVDHHFIRPDGPAYRLARRVEHRIDHLAPRILTSSARARELLVDAFGCRPERLIHAPDCVNTEMFVPARRDAGWLQRRRERGIADDRLTVVYLGLLADYQGTGHLLRAMALLVQRGLNVHLLLGGYPNIEHYQEMAGQLGLTDRVSFAGRVPYGEAPDFISLGDIAIAPKLSKTEGAGKILNYMATGLPTVVYDTRVSREYLGELGIYARFGSVESLAERIAALAQRPDLRTELGAALRARAQAAFTWDRTGHTILQTYAELLSGHGAARASACA